MRKPRHYDNAEIELSSHFGSSVIPPEEQPLTQPANPPATASVDVMKEVNIAYSSASTGELPGELAADMALGIGELADVLGPLAGFGIWIALKACPLQVRKKLLEDISRFRRGLKSGLVIGNTIESTDLPTAVVNPLKASLAAVGIIIGIALVTHLSDQLKTLEERFARREQLNRLLTAEMQRGGKIPKQLSQVQLIEWLKDPTRTQFADLPREAITVADFQQCQYTEEERRRLTRLKISMEMINGLYALNILDTDLALMGMSGFMTAGVSLGFQLIVGAVLISSYYEIAQHHVKGIILQSTQSQLSAKLTLIETKLAQFPDAEKNNNPEYQELLADRDKTKTELQTCEQQIQEHSEVDLSPALLRIAFCQGIQEGGKTVGLFGGVPISCLVLAHVIAATFWPAYVVLLSLTIGWGLYCGYQRYQEKREEINKKKAQQSAIVPAPSVSNGSAGFFSSKKSVPAIIKTQRPAFQCSLPATA